MKIYFVSRWGNPEEGPNGADTNFLVWAENRDDAAAIVDEFIPHFPAINGPNVTPFCHLVIEMGTAGLYGTARTSVIHGPWIGHAILRGGESVHLSWSRQDPDSGWEMNPQTISDDTPTLPHSDPPGPPTEPPGPPDEADAEEPL